MSSMSIRMKKMATVENLIANRPSDTAIGSLPHSNGSAFTGVGPRGARSLGVPSSPPATRAPKTDVLSIGAEGLLPGAPSPVRPVGAGVTAAVTRDLVETLHRLGVVVQDVRPRVEHRLERRGAALEVGNQILHAAARRLPTHRTDRRRPVRGAAIREVVTVDRRDHDVVEP